MKNRVPQNCPRPPPGSRNLAVGGWGTAYGTRTAAVLGCEWRGVRAPAHDSSGEAPPELAGGDACGTRGLPIAMLVVSNVFMTSAWSGHLRACLKTLGDRRVRARGLQDWAGTPGACRPGALIGRVFTHALKHTDRSLGLVILVSWGIASFEYCLMVPANRWGSRTYSPFQLKIIQEVVTQVTFIAFAFLYFCHKPPVESCRGLPGHPRRGGVHVSAGEVNRSRREQVKTGRGA